MTLPSDLRRRLEGAVTSARVVAETGARAALEALAVHHREPYGHMTPQQRTLRGQLRIHARQIGDRCDEGSQEQAIDRLVHECAYEQWHGMLFARFLAENDLLIEPKLGVPVTLDECERLGAGDGVDKWTMAGRFAHEMLPQVFRPDLPVFAVRFAKEHRLELEHLVEELPTGVFAASDALGWVYQFWQSRRRKEVNDSEVKIGADELPAVTQWFTEPYMVRFLLDNTLGAWWAARRLTASDLRDASDEAELRRRASIPGVPLEYLRFVRCEDAEPSEWRPAGGACKGWPEHLGELKVLDPCCGSGHFLAAAFSMLVTMRMAREGLDARHAVDAVLRDNLHGLELDPRCVEIAAFALALAAWTYPDAGGYRPLPALNLACSGLSVGTARESWTSLAGGRRDLRLALNWMYGAFGDAPVLGSLLNPATTEAARLAGWPLLSEVLTQALALEQSEERREMAVVAHGLARAAELLVGRYHWVITNVPYLARARQSQALQDFCARHHPVARSELATVFLERCLELCLEGGVASLVLPQNWLFLKRYRKLREQRLTTETWRLLARLGPNAFETIKGEIVKAILLSMDHLRPGSQSAELWSHNADGGMLCGLDVSDDRTPAEKAGRLAETEITCIPQATQLENADAGIQLKIVDHEKLMGRLAFVRGGTTSGDSAYFRRFFWEVMRTDGLWSIQQTTARNSIHYTGRECVLGWDGGGGELAARTRGGGATIAGKDAWHKNGIAISYMKDLNVTLYSGEIFENIICTLVPQHPAHLAALWCFCSSPSFSDAVRSVNQKLSVDVRYFERASFDVDHWAAVAEERYPNGLPRPYSDDPTQWIFHGHPCGSVVWNEAEKRTAPGPLRTDASVLHVAVARLLGYRWPAEGDAEMELADEQREWVGRCASLSAWADEDGIICIPSVRRERSAGERLLGLLVAAYGDSWTDDVLARLLTAVGSPNLDDWLRNRFFEQHCELFRQRPFIWHVWDGRKRDGFHALVSGHRLTAAGGRGRRLLELLTYSHLGAWIGLQRSGVQEGRGGAEDRLAAAVELQQRLEHTLGGEPPFDIFVRWKPLDEQPIGWEPDVDDGVRINIRPFLARDLPGGRKGAGVLRVRPSVHWRKDRGREPRQERERFPWFWKDGEFTANRINDVHLSTVEKRAARERREST